MEGVRGIGRMRDEGSGGKQRKEDEGKMREEKGEKGV